MEDVPYERCGDYWYQGGLTCELPVGHSSSHMAVVKW